MKRNLSGTADVSAPLLRPSSARRIDILQTLIDELRLRCLDIPAIAALPSCSSSSARNDVFQLYDANLVDKLRVRCLEDSVSLGSPTFRLVANPAAIASLFDRLTQIKVREGDEAISVRQSTSCSLAVVSMSRRLAPTNAFPQAVLQPGMTDWSRRCSGSARQAPISRSQQFRAVTRPLDF